MAVIQEPTKDQRPFPNQRHMSPKFENKLCFGERNAIHKIIEFRRAEKCLHILTKKQMGQIS